MRTLVTTIEATPWQPWVTVAARVVLGGALLYAGLLKVGDLRQSVAAVKAYQLPFPDWFITLIGNTMPFVEIIVGAAVVLGVFTRWTAGLCGLAMVAYIIGIASAWARGLSIDCGCFTPGGELSPGEATQYLLDIVRDFALLLLAVWVVVFPKTPLSVDSWIAGPGQPTADAAE